MKRKLVAIGLAVLLLFSIFGCGKEIQAYKTEGKANIDAYVETLLDNDYSEANWEEIEQLAISGKAEIDKATTREDIDNIANATKAEIGSVLNREEFQLQRDTGKIEIDTCVEKLTENNYLTENWLEIQRLVSNGKVEIDQGNTKTEIDRVIENTKNAIDKVKKEFSLAITTSTTSFNLGQDIEVEVTFKNQSGERCGISHADPMIVPIVVDSEHYDGKVFTVSILSSLEKDEIIRFSWQIGSVLPVGEHELFASTTFALHQIEDDKIVSSKSIRVRSNTIVLTVN